MKLPKRYEYKPWAVILAGCGPSYFDTRTEAEEYAKGEVEGNLGLIVAIFKLHRFARAKVCKPTLHKLTQGDQ